MVAAAAFPGGAATDAEAFDSAARVDFAQAAERAMGEGRA